MASPTITLYHYTSKEAAKAIERLKVIKSSKGEGRDAHFGDGVYFTDMSPKDFTRTEVSRNNYHFSNAKKKLEDCIIVTMPKSKVHKCKAGNRRVFLHEGDVKLENKDYSYNIEKSKFKDPPQTSTGMVSQQRGAGAMSNLPNDIDVTASSYALHIWLSSF